jgi:XTP/dITP diphosphohydrolase
MKTLPSQLLIATRNPGKVAEIQEMLRDLPTQLRYLEEFPDISPVAEVGRSYEENATVKAITYSKQTGLYALADDSGLEVDALGGAPGVMSARFGGDGASDQARISQLLLALSRTPDRDRRSRFVCCMALAGSEVVKITEGKCEGHVADEPRGANGFGYDPIFVPDNYDSTFGQLSQEVKSKISHRAQALAAMRDFIRDWLR